MSDNWKSKIGKSVTWKSDTWKWVAVGVCLALFATDTVLKPHEKPNRMIFFELHRGSQPVVIGMMRDDLLKLPGRGAERLSNALAQGQPLTVWQYGLRKAEDGSYQASPDRQIELTSADASLVTFGAKIRLPD